MRIMFNGINTLMRYIILLLSISLHSQVIINHDVTSLNDLPNDWTIGNGCGIDNYVDVFVLGDLELKADCYLYNARLTVHGYVVYNGYTITMLCAEDELIEIGYLGVDIREKNSITLYPNPTSGFIYVNTKQPYALSIYDLTGKLVGTSNDVSNLSNGMYLVVIRIDDNSYTYKIIKN